MSTPIVFVGALDAQAALLREAAEVLGMFGDYTVSSIGMDLDGYVIKLAAGGQQPMFADFDRARSLLHKLTEATKP